MPTLENINGASLVPDIVGNFSQGMQLGQQFRKQADQRETEKLIAAIEEGGPDAYKASKRLHAINPDALQQQIIIKHGQLQNASDEAKLAFDRHGSDAFEISHYNTPEAKNSYLDAQINAATINGDMDRVKEFQGYKQAYKADPKSFDQISLFRGSTWEHVKSYDKSQTAAMQNADAIMSEQDPEKKALLQQLTGTDGHGGVGGKDPRLVGAPSGNMWNDPNDPTKGVTPIPGIDNKKLKQIPVRAMQGNQKNNQSLRDIDDALKELDAYPQAFGLTNVLGDTVKQRTDPKGVAARAALTKISAIEIHDKAGSAQGVQEVARLKPYVPSTSDDPDVIRKKLNKMRQEFVDQDQEFKDTYNEDYGYINPNNGQAAPVQTTPNIPTQNAKGWVLHTDKNGAKAYVSPDGTQVEEINNGI